eukprot:CAMPEP_0167788684 /NCGR_PEP_ID=MMETSP0111_2-20121227/10187_1 /TAXON_ID=91324 /ORGANISM="Lotharella globosa, Strain CCCM811" /LENGTH=337 /DNA_ID=CAMNT_0007680609 /DNA_START=290 /DNA_END=1303 /DNA_ORIENTATION=-
MGGVGSFEKPSQTLYVGGLPGYSKEAEDAVRREFGEFGKLERVYYLKDKGCCFVRYKLRACAEFAKEAMIGQHLTLGNNPRKASAKKMGKKKVERRGAVAATTGTLNIRWAHDDPNPRTVRMEANRRRSQLEAKLTQHIRQQVRVQAPQHAAGIHVAPNHVPPSHPAFPPNVQPNLASAYPDTSSQYPGVPSQQPSSQYPNTSSQYPNTSSQYPNTSSQYPGVSSQYPDTSSQYPDTSLQYPDASSHPDNLLEYPDTSSQYPDTLSQHPDPTDTDTTKNNEAAAPKKRQRVEHGKAESKQDESSDDDDDGGGGVVGLVLPDIASSVLGMGGYESNSD